ncbi:hypothetical protein [Actinomadura formosensis]|uniref:hypothetical protein n=1 Tax=Actinomadura formosensis TaxID=60706 RepID=UPI003D8B6C32
MAAVEAASQHPVGAPRGRRAARTIHANLARAFACNLVTIPLAVLGRLSPMLAAAAMSFSSVLVAVNSLRLLRGGHR